MPHSGAERRIHKVFMTRNTEYHLRRTLCVAVRDRRTGRWVDDHRALRRHAAGAISFFGEGGLAVKTQLPDLGESLCFDGLSLVTSPVVAIRRPPKEIVHGYRDVEAA